MKVIVSCISTLFTSKFLLLKASLFLMNNAVVSTIRSSVGSSTEETAGCSWWSIRCTTYRPACDGQMLILITFCWGGEEAGEERWASQPTLFTLHKSALLHVKRQWRWKWLTGCPRWRCRRLMAASTLKLLDPWPEYKLEICIVIKATAEDQFLFCFFLERDFFRYLCCSEWHVIQRSLSPSVCVRINRRRAPDKEREAGVIRRRTNLEHSEPGGTPLKQPITALRKPSRTISVAQRDTREVQSGGEKNKTDNWTARIRSYLPSPRQYGPQQPLM